MFLRISIVAILSSLLLIACGPQKTEASFVFSISGRVNTVHSGDVILYKVSDVNQKVYDAVDTLSIAKDGSFSENYNLEPHYYIINFYDSLQVPLIADKGQQIVIHLNGDGSYELSGSKDTELFEAYEAFRREILEALVYPVRREVSALKKLKDPIHDSTINYLAGLQLNRESKYRDTLITYVKKMGTSIAIYPTTIRWGGDENLVFYDSLAKAFSEDHPNLEVSKWILRKVQLMKQVAIGGKVSDISSTDTANISQELYKNLQEYTLINFWGSWCAPCRSESEGLIAVYNQYHDRGFEIFGVAFEQKREAWIRAINQDELNWPNVSDLSGYKNKAAEEYSITSLPKNFLVNKEGVIIAKDIHEEELEAKLAQLLPTE